MLDHANRYGSVELERQLIFRIHEISKTETKSTQKATDSKQNIFDKVSAIVLKQKYLHVPKFL